MSSDNEVLTTHGPGESSGNGLPHFEAQVTVNGKPVILRERRVTGLQIKQAAIQQQVSIEPSFILQEELPNGHHKIIGDIDVIEVRDHERFTAIPNDDNS
jgi:hypothetical protein